MSVDAPLFVGQVLIIPDLAECSITNDADNVEFVQEYHSRSIWLSTHQNQFPHAIVRNTDELQNFIQSYILQHWGNQFTDIEDYISEATSKFDETFFEERMLIFAYVETSTGAATAEVSEITYNELGVLELHIETHIPGWTPDIAVTADIGNHLLITSLPTLDVERLIVITHWAH